MKTKTMKVLKVRQNKFENILEIAVAAIKRGEILICPSDTVYGLICDAQNEKAVNRLFKIKKRVPQKAIALFVRDIKMAKELARIDAAQEKFLSRVWPGKVTAILKSKKELAGITLQGTIGLRIPKHKLLLELLQKLKGPLAQTSANISGRPALTKICDVLRDFEKQKEQPDLVLDAGNLPNSLPSTVLDLTDKKIKVLRQGALPRPLFNLV